MRLGYRRPVFSPPSPAEPELGKGGPPAQSAEAELGRFKGSCAVRLLGHHIRAKRPTSASAETGSGVAALLAVLLLALVGCFEEPPRLLEQGDPLAEAEAWLEVYPEVEEHPHLARAQEIFDRMRQTVGTHAELLVLEMGHGARARARALALPDETVILSESGLALCYDGVPPEVGDARLAFLLGHELTHVANDDFWHASAFATVRGVKEEGDARSRLQELLTLDGKERQVLELRADDAGVLAVVQAGYDPAPLLRPDRSFFEEWVGGAEGSLSYADPSHPSPRYRAEFLQKRLAEVADRMEVFHQGVAAFREAEAMAAADRGREVLPKVAAKYQEAVERFDRFRRHFDGREVLSNLALAHLRLAAGRLAACDGMLVNRYYLPTVLDPVTLAERVRHRGARDYSSPCFENEEYQAHIREAIRFLKEAVERDPAHLPARLNLVAAYVIDEQTARAANLARETAERFPDDLMASAAWAASFLAYLDSGVKWLDSEAILEEIVELHRRFPREPALAFNLASALSYRGRLEEALPVWRAFLEVEPESSPWAAIAREWVGEETVGGAQVARR